MSLTILTWIFFPDNSVFYFFSCRNSFFCNLNTSAVQIVRFSWLMDFQRTAHNFCGFFFSSSESHGQTKLHQMIEIALPFWKNIGFVSLFSRVCENRKGNIMSLASKMYLDIHLFAVCFCNSSHYFKMISWSHNLLYIINPVHTLLIKTICYLIWFVLIRGGYIIGHKAQMENSVSQINWCEYLNSTENIC